MLAGTSRSLVLVVADTKRAAVVPVEDVPCMDQHTCQPLGFTVVRMIRNFTGKDFCYLRNDLFSPFDTLIL